ncbi:unnamed protein product [Camellia sinensis]
MMRGSATIVFLVFACIGMCVTRGLAINEPKSLSSSKLTDGSGWRYGWGSSALPGQPCMKLPPGYDSQRCARTVTMSSFCMLQLQQTAQSGGQSYISLDCCHLLKDFNVCSNNFLVRRFGNDFCNKYLNC